MTQPSIDVRPDLREESARLADRLSRCLGAATWEMDTFCRLAGVEASRSVPTAAVTCEGRPRLLINPDFAARHCVRDEHLFLLAMHELWHVLLAHTRLYARPTPDHNVAFDAVINAGLARQFPGVAYRGFFEDLNSAVAFPGLLLRPPTGWPSAPIYPSAIGPEDTARVLEALYPRPGPEWAPMPTYAEILDLLTRARGTSGSERIVVLIGSHGEGDDEAEARAIDDPVLGSIVRRIVGKWPPPPVRIAGRDEGGTSDPWRLRPERVEPTARAAFAALLRRLLVFGPGGATERQRAFVPAIAGLGVLPNGRDRTIAARRALGLPATLWAQELPRRVRTTRSVRPAHVYLDVSGSMSELLPRLLDLLVPYVRTGRARTFQFSTVVCPLTLAELSAGKLRTTRGTAIGPVLEHAIASRGAGRIVLVTDGYTGEPERELVARVRARGVEVHVVLPSESGWIADLDDIAASMTVLPPLSAEPHP